MGRFLAGTLLALLLVAAGLFWWQSQAAGEKVRIPVPMMAAVAPEALPDGDDNAMGAAPPMPAGASQQSKEQRRFGRYDRNRDGAITRVEMLSSRTKAFKQLDTDGNNLLSFEEWAVATSQRFAGADGDGNGTLSAAEFAATAPKVKARAACKC